MQKILKPKNKIIIGIDPGYDRLGICILEKNSQNENKLLFSDCLESDKKQELNERIFNLCQKVKKIILNFSARGGPVSGGQNQKEIEMAIEKLFFTTNQKTAMGVSQLRGAIIYLANTLNIKVVEYTPLQIKIALTGYGKAEKKQVEFMVDKILNLKKNNIENKNVKKIKSVKIIDDEYDAIACALTHAAILRL